MSICKTEIIGCSTPTIRVYERGQGLGAVAWEGIRAARCTVEWLMYQLGPRGAVRGKICQR